MMNEGLVQGQNLQDLQANIQQDNIQNQNENQDFQEDGYIDFHNYIKYKSNLVIRTAQISNDEKYLAIDRDKRVQIYYLKNKKLIKNLKLDDQENDVNIIKLSINPSHLLIGDNNGNLYCCDVNNNLKIIYNQRIHSSVINDILTIDDDQILTGSWDKSLIITNIRNNYQLFKISNAHTSWINAIDFDKSNNFIISCSNDKSIKFFNRNDGKCQMDQQKAHKFPIQMIQLISKDNNQIISSDCYKLILWQIDYQGLQLNKLKEFNNRIYHFYNFTSVFNNNKIIVQCPWSNHILDKYLDVLQSIKYNIQLYCIYYIMIQASTKTKQLNSLNFIIVQGIFDFLVLKKVRRLLN